MVGVTSSSGSFGALVNVSLASAPFEGLGGSGAGFESFGGVPLGSASWPIFLDNSSRSCRAASFFQKLATFDGTNGKD